MVLTCGRVLLLDAQGELSEGVADSVLRLSLRCILWPR